MFRMRVLLIGLSILCLGLATGAVAKERTADVEGEVLTDKVYGYTFTKNENWKFDIPKEKPEEPKFLRFEMAKAVFQIPADRAFSPETWTVTYGGFFVDTTSLTLKEFRDTVIRSEDKHKQRKMIAKRFDLMRNGELNEVLDVQFGAFGPAYCMTYSEEYDVQILDRAENYNVITDRLIGDLYFTVHGGHVYGLYFFSERADYRLCRTEVQRMIDSIALVETGEKADSASVESESDPADTTKSEAKDEDSH